MNKLRLLFLSLCFTAFLSCEKSEFSGTEIEQIDQYIAAKNLQVSESFSSGLRVAVTKENPSGTTLSKGNYVTVAYAGRLLNDKEFDSGSFSFVLGAGQVVRGFDEGVAQLKTGEQGTIIFPSALGYGSMKQGSIPKNSPLIFDIEILGVQ
ncbi:FKBP-type peptidyl-prolyl cis-trans isomerase [Jiulongibacter sediminis]|uniref:FKBP-type peptidyl-prolyl cis-trans isomerase n=1 Tax=Jiulongibacter sediminis TaxID=1605367 RepID=UPI0009EA2EBA|nr:FKBP-type peptidyl-prolyl cis-trans isomerase [Jiulongibacter sediminis]